MRQHVACHNRCLHMPLGVMTMLIRTRCLCPICPCLGKHKVSKKSVASHRTSNHSRVGPIFTLHVCHGSDIHFTRVSWFRYSLYTCVMVPIFTLHVCHGSDIHFTRVSWFRYSLYTCVMVPIFTLHVCHGSDIHVTRVSWFRFQPVVLVHYRTWSLRDISDGDRQFAVFRLFLFFSLYITRYSP